MALVVRPAGYTGFLQRLVWAQGDNVPVTAYLWGGGGAGGGADSASGGSGGGAGYTQVNFVVNEGDIIEVAVAEKAPADRTVPATVRVVQLGPVMLLIFISTPEMRLHHLLCFHSLTRPTAHF